MSDTLAVIGGSGLYEMEGLERVEHVPVETPFGTPSDSVVAGWLGGTRLLFLPRHGRGHRVPPHRIDYRANVFALKQLGATHVVSVSAVGSMKESIAPGDVVIVDQMIDRTRTRPQTFFEDRGIVAHVGLADPTDAALSTVVREAALACVREAGTGAQVHEKGTYVCIEGPQFSTRAESRLFRSWGVDVIGMTAFPEARLAREAELSYAVMAFATDYDCWHESEADVTVEVVLEVLRRNVATARAIIGHVSQALPPHDRSPASRALAGAIMTSPEAVPAETKRLLAPLIAKYGY